MPRAVCGNNLSIAKTGQISTHRNARQHFALKTTKRKRVISRGVLRVIPGKPSAGRSLVPGTAYFSSPTGEFLPSRLPQSDAGVASNVVGGNLDTIAKRVN